MPILSYKTKAYTFFAALLLILAIDLGALACLAFSFTMVALGMIGSTLAIAVALSSLFVHDLARGRAQVSIQPAE